MKKLFSILMGLLLTATGAFAQSQGVSMRSTNGTMWNSFTVNGVNPGISYTNGAGAGNQDAFTFTNTFFAINGIAGIPFLNIGQGGATTFAVADAGGNFQYNNGTFTMTGAGGYAGIGTSLTALNGSAVTSGTVPAAQLGSGSGTAGTFLRNDNTFQKIGGAGFAHVLSTLYISTNTWGVSNSITRVSMFGTNNGVGTLTLGTGDMNVGTKIHLSFWGPYLETTGDALGVAFYIGGTQIYTNTWTTGTGGGATQLMHMEVDITFRAIGASGSVILDGVRDIPAVINSTFIGTLTTVDTTGSRAIEATIVWGTAQANNNFTVDQAIVTYSP